MRQATPWLVALGAVSLAAIGVSMSAKRSSVPYVAPDARQRRDSYATPAEARAALGSLSQYVSWEDAFRVSDTPIPHDVAVTMRAIAPTYMDPVAADLGGVHLTSWWRRGATLSGGRPSSHATAVGWDWRVGPTRQGGIAGAHRVADVYRSRAIPVDRSIGYDGARSSPPRDGDGHVHTAAEHPTAGTRAGLVLHARAGRTDYTVIPT